MSTVARQFGSSSAVVRYPETGSTWELLWENEDPTASFAAQTVSLDLSSYDAILVLMRYSTSAGRTVSSIACVGDSGQLVMIGAWSSATAYVVVRGYSSTTSEVSFDSAYRRSLNATTAPSAGNTYAIPTNIYGIKF